MPLQAQPRSIAFQMISLQSFRLCQVSQCTSKALTKITSPALPTHSHGWMVALQCSSSSVYTRFFPVDICPYRTEGISRENSTWHTATVVCFGDIQVRRYRSVHQSETNLYLLQASNCCNVLCLSNVSTDTIVRSEQGRRWWWA